MNDDKLENGLNKDLSVLGEEVIRVCRGLDYSEKSQSLYDLPYELEDTALIKSYRSLVESQTKDRATIKELLEALKPISTRLYVKSCATDMSFAFVEISTDEAMKADQVYTKHSTDTEVKK